METVGRPTQIQIFEYSIQSNTIKPFMFPLEMVFNIFCFFLKTHWMNQFQMYETRAIENHNKRNSIFLILLITYARTCFCIDKKIIMPSLFSSISSNISSMSSPQFVMILSTLCFTKKSFFASANWYVICLCLLPFPLWPKEMYSVLFASFFVPHCVSVLNLQVCLLERTKI